MVLLNVNFLQGQVQTVLSDVEATAVLQSVHEKCTAMAQDTRGLNFTPPVCLNESVHLDCAEDMQYAACIAY